MKERVEILAVIPARGGSKGLPRKNVLPLAGRPLIGHSIAAAQGATCVGRCVVSTEDPEIADVAVEAGAEVLDRPDSLAGDTVRTHEVVLHVLETLGAQGYQPDLVILLQPTSPLRTAGHIRDCLKCFLPRWRAGEARSIVGVTEEEHSPYKSFLVDEVGCLTPLFDAEKLERPRQLLPKVYRQNGALYVVDAAGFHVDPRFFLPPSLPFIMAADGSVDIDTLADMRWAETILKARNG